MLKPIASMTWVSLRTLNLRWFLPTILGVPTDNPLASEFGRQAALFLDAIRNSDAFKGAVRAQHDGGDLRAAEIDAEVERAKRDLQGSLLAVRLEEAAVRVTEPVRGACEILGFDPLYVANEGKCLAIVARERADARRRRLQRVRLQAAARRRLGDHEDDEPRHEGRHAVQGVPGKERGVRRGRKRDRGRRQGDGQGAAAHC